ncbi:MAG TPA: histidinol dehydrogenase, partial [Bacillota bacterium]|nr:histidinol dehydrogenase [Bacillota bacterium]
MFLPLYTVEQYREKAAPRTLADFTAERQEVCRIIEEVRRRGDAALQDYTKQFDGVFLESFKVSEAEYATAEKAVDHALAEALRGARENIARFHRRQVE